MNAVTRTMALVAMLPCAQTFVSLSMNQIQAQSWRSGAINNHGIEENTASLAVGRADSRRRRRRPKGMLMGTEEVEDFDLDVEINTEKLDVFSTIITQVKMEGRVPASTHLVYDCSHGEWLLAQMAYDRKIRLFSSRSVRQLGTISSFLPDNSRFIFSGALIPKQVKRILKMKGLSAIVANDVDGAIAMDQAMNTERDRLEAKQLSRISPSRERYLLREGNNDRSNAKGSPVRSVVSNLLVFVRMRDGQSAEELADTIKTIDRKCSNLAVVGLWGGGMREDTALNMLETVRTKSGMSQLRVAMDHHGPPSAEWFKGLRGPRRGPIMWTFAFEL